MLNYQVMNEQEAMQERFQLMRDGEYDAVIEKSEDKVSANSGNPMMDMTLSVYDQNGKAYPVRDFLVFTNSMMWKVIHCADSAGLIKEYEEKKFCSEVAQGSRVRVRITTEVGGEIPQDKLKGKPLGSKYPDKNKVDDYLKKDIASKAANNKDDFVDDIDIPF